MLSEPLTMHMSVTIQRVNIPGHKLEPEAVGLASYYWDGDLGERGLQPQYAVSVRQDEALARRLTDHIAALVGRDAPRAAVP